MALDSGSTGFKLSSPLQAHPAVTIPSSSGLHSHPPFLPVSLGSPVCDFSLRLFTSGATFLPPDSVISSVSPLGWLEHWSHPAPSTASDTGVLPAPLSTLVKSTNQVSLLTHLSGHWFSPSESGWFCFWTSPWNLLYLSPFFFTLCRQWSTVAKRVGPAIRSLRSIFHLYNVSSNSTCLTGFLLGWNEWMHTKHLE